MDCEASSSLSSLANRCIDRYSMLDDRLRACVRSTRESRAPKNSNWKSQRPCDASKLKKKQERKREKVLLFLFRSCPPVLYTPYIEFFSWTKWWRESSSGSQPPPRATPATLRPSIAERRQKRSGGEERDKVVRGGVEFLVDGSGGTKG